MKSEKGITLMTLIIYMIVMCFVISMLAIISDLFYANTNYITENSKYISEYNKFTMYFIEDIKNNEDVTQISDNEIILEDGTVYTYKSSTDNGIYRNKVKICTNIVYCKFSKTEEEVDDVIKNIIQVHMIIKGSNLFETNNEYVLKYW